VRWRAAAKLGVAQLRGTEVKLSVAQIKRVAMRGLTISLQKMVLLEM